jgi:hypothetical protein
MPYFNVNETVSNKLVCEQVATFAAAHDVAVSYQKETGLDCNIEKVELVYTTQTIDTAIAHR